MNSALLFPVILDTFLVAWKLYASGDTGKAFILTLFVIKFCIVHSRDPGSVRIYEGIPLNTSTA